MPCTASTRNLAILACALGLSLGLVLSSCSGGGPDRHVYNVLLVTLDTTRLDHLGCYGAQGDPTPHLDALASAGIRFDMAISPSASTPVSHASILTGLNPYQHGLRVIYADGGCRLSEGVPTLGTWLGARGRRTGAFLSSFTVSDFYGLDRGFDTFDSGLPASAASAMSKTSGGFWDWPLRDNQRRADATTAQACRWIAGTPEPFFAWVHYWDPHDPVVLPPAEFLNRYVTPEMEGDARQRAIYRAEVAYVDSQFGRLIDCLKERNLYDRTIIVVVADHGEGLGDHGWWYHRILYQEQIRVPLLVRVPRWPAGRVVTDLVRTTDIAPTLLGLLGLTIPPGLEGRSLAGLIEGVPEEPRLAYADAINLFDLNARMVEARPDDGLLYCAMDRTWKFIHRPNREGKDELYNLSVDPAEQRNLLSREPEQAARMLREVIRFDGFVTRPFGEALDPAVLERLRSLGYLGN
jgi:arylsulfatase A-like enzyme